MGNRIILLVFLISVFTYNVYAANPTCTISLPEEVYVNDDFYINLYGTDADGDLTEANTFMRDIDNVVTGIIGTDISGTADTANIKLSINRTGAVPIIGQIKDAAGGSTLCSVETLYVTETPKQPKAIVKPNTVAAPGSLWVEDRYLHWTNSTHEMKIADKDSFYVGTKVDNDTTISISNTIINDYTYMTSHLDNEDNIFMIDDSSDLYIDQEIMLHQTQSGEGRSTSFAQSVYEFLHIKDIRDNSGRDGSSQDDAAYSCLDIINGYPSSTSGVYWIDPNLGDTSDAYQVYCNMDIDGGGWVLMTNFISSLDGGSTPYSTALHGNAIDSFADLDAAGWSRYLTTIDTSGYTRVSGYSQMYYSSSPIGYIERSLPAGYNEVYVKWGNWYGGTANLYIGGTSVQALGGNYGAATYQGNYNNGDTLKFTENGIFWAGEIWVRETTTPIFVETYELTKNQYWSQSGIDGVSTYDVDGEITQIVTVPQYDTLTINSGSSITAQTWNGNTGGILAFRANKVVNLGSIDVEGKGFRGGRDSGLSGCSYGEGEQGESYEGYGICGGYAGTTGYLANAGGGGVCVNGGGGAYGTDGGIAQDYTGGNCASTETGQGGDAYGNKYVFGMYLGSGGAGGHSNSGLPNGGNGGGIIYFTTETLDNIGTIASVGADGWYRNSDQGYWASGGGSGGSIYIIAENFSNSGVIIASGGTDAPGTHSSGLYGGDGGVGRIRIDYKYLPLTETTGTITPSADYCRVEVLDLTNNGYTALSNTCSLEWLSDGEVELDTNEGFNIYGLPSLEDELTIIVKAKSTQTNWYRIWSLISRYDQFIIGTNTDSTTALAFLTHLGSWRYSPYYTTDPDVVHTYAAVYDSSTTVQDLYVDGTKVVSGSFSGVLTTDINKASIGLRDYDNTGGNYIYDYVKIYNRTLSSTEIANHETVYDGLLAYYEFDNSRRIEGGKAGSTWIENDFMAFVDSNGIKNILGYELS